MPDYLLTCTCGHKNVVSTAQAGDNIRCTCGLDLQVPTMRGLRELEPAGPETAHRKKAASTAWDDRSRVAFVLAVGAITCLCVAIYLGWTMPPAFVQPPDEAFGQAVDSIPMSQLIELHKDAVRGVLPPPMPESIAMIRIRSMMIWAVGIVLVLGAIATAASLVVMFKRPAPRKK